MIDAYCGLSPSNYQGSDGSADAHLRAVVLVLQSIQSEHVFVPPPNQLPSPRCPATATPTRFSLVRTRFR